MPNVVERYKTKRDEFYRHLEKHVAFTHGIWIEAGPIEDNHVYEIANWPLRACALRWYDLRGDFRRVPQRLELAVTIHDEFCGLAIGKPSRGKTRLASCSYEVKSGLDPDWEVLNIMEEALTLWAILLDVKCAEVSLLTPVSRSWPVTEVDAEYFFRPRKDAGPAFKV